MVLKVKISCKNEEERRSTRSVEIYNRFLLLKQNYFDARFCCPSYLFPLLICLHICFLYFLVYFTYLFILLTCSFYLLVYFTYLFILLTCLFYLLVYFTYLFILLTFLFYLFVSFTYLFILLIYITYLFTLLTCYEWAKRTKILLPVIYESPRRHSNSSKTFKKIGKDRNKFVRSF